MGKGRVAYEKAWAWRIVFLALGAVAASGSAASVVAAKVDDDEASGSSVRQQPPAGAAFPFPYNWSKFPTAWFAANATDWESEAQLAEIGKYSMAILGWQHLAATTHWEAIVYTQIEQAAIIKKAHPGMPVFVYSGFGFAAGFNNGTWPALNSVLKDPKVRTATSSFRARPRPSPHRPIANRATHRLGRQATTACPTSGTWLTHPRATTFWRT